MDNVLCHTLHLTYKMLQLQSEPSGLCHVYSPVRLYCYKLGGQIGGDKTVALPPVFSVPLVTRVKEPFASIINLGNILIQNE